MPPLPLSPDTRRRLFLYGHRLARTVTGRGVRKRIFFLHLPKCGGTSVSAGLFGTVALQNRIGVIDALSTRQAAAYLHFGRTDLLLCHEDLENGDKTFALREGLCLSHLFWTTRLIYGHVLLTPRLMSVLRPRCQLVTMMRDPMDRAISNYRMAVRAGVIPDDVDGWLAGPVGRSMCHAYLRYLGGQTVVPDSDVPVVTERAIAALDAFALVGQLNDLAGFRRDFAALFGTRPAIPHYNAARGPALSLTSAQRDRMEVLLAPDRAIHAAALRTPVRRAGQTEKIDGSQPVLARHSAY